MEAEEIITEIEKVFCGLKKPQTSLRQYVLTDEKGMSGTITDEEWKNAGKNRQDQKWQDIPDSEIKECDCMLAHMPAEDFIYYLPAYMRYSLNNHTLPLWESDIIGSTVFALYASSQDKNLYEYVVQQHSLLNSEQIDSIKSFLEFVSINAEDVQRPDAIKALERYWSKK